MVIIWRGVGATFDDDDCVCLCLCERGNLCFFATAMWLQQPRQPEQVQSIGMQDGVVVCSKARQGIQQSAGGFLFGAFCVERVLKKITPSDHRCLCQPPRP